MSPSKTLAKIDPPDTTLAEFGGESVNVQSLLLLTIEKGVPAETMERILAMQERMDAARAKRAFNQAFASFQSECAPIIKLKQGAKPGIKYAPIEQIAEEIQPLLDKHQLSYRFDTVDPEPGWVSAVCIVTHILGHSVPSTVKLPIDQGNKLMTAPQQYAGAISFAQRRALQNALGIVTKGDDRDGAAPRDRHGEARTQTEPAKPKMTPEDIKNALHGRIWNRLAPHPKFKGKNDDETWENIDKWIIGGLMMEPAEKFENLPNDRLARIADAAENEFDSPGF